MNIIKNNKLKLILTLSLTLVLTMVLFKQAMPDTYANAKNIALAYLPGYKPIENTFKTRNIINKHDNNFFHKGNHLLIMSDYYLHRYKNMEVACLASRIKTIALVNNYEHISNSALDKKDELLELHDEMRKLFNCDRFKYLNM